MKSPPKVYAATIDGFKLQHAYSVGADIAFGRDLPHRQIVPNFELVYV
jgi:hypothetical protein